MKKTLLFFLVLLGNLLLFGQSASITSYTQNIVCPSTGSATVSTDISNPSFVLYHSANNSAVGAPQNSPVFGQLTEGSYYVKVVGDNGTSAVTDVFVINTSYTPMSAADISADNICSSYTAGGVIKVNSVTGGSAPYKYVFVKTSNANFDDSALTYTTNNTYNADSYGTYQVRIKDNCGATYTVSKTIAPTLQPIKRMDFSVANNVDCTGTNATMYNYAFYDANGGSIDYTPYANAGGIKLEMWEQPSSGCPTAAPATAPVFQGFITASSYAIPVVPSKKYVLRITTPCGDQSVFCLDKTQVMTRRFAINEVTSKSDCNGAETITIKPTENYFFNFPVNVSIKNSAGNIVYTQNNVGSASNTIQQNSQALNGWLATNLPMDSYTVTYTDSCGIDTSLSFTDPSQAGPMTVEGADYFLWRCGDIPVEKVTGTTQMGLYIGGYVPNSANAVIKIKSGPSNVGVAGVLMGNQYYGWSNILPGNYVFTITDPACGTSTDLSYTVTPDDTDILKQSIVSTPEQICSGGGDIESTVVYNGAYDYIVELLDNTGTVIGSSSNGSFSNLPAGTYTTRLKVTPYCDTNNPYYVNGNTMTFTAAGAPPTIARRMGIICEDSNGAQLTYGNIFVTIQGAGPITLQYRKVGVSNWTNATTNASTYETISGLPLGDYEIRALDACGNSTANYPTSLLPVGQINAANSTQPCYDSPYELKLPNYDTPQVTYEWRDPAGNLLTTNYNYQIANYTPANDGVYTATVKLGTCVTRHVTLNLNGANCGQPIGVACYKPADNTIAGLPSNVGITSIGRAGAPGDNWPMSRLSAHIVLESKSKGFVINRMETDASGQVPASVIPAPEKGMMIYDKTNKCLKIFDGVSWKCYTRPACPSN